MEPSCFGS